MKTENEELADIRIVSALNTVAFEETNIRISGSYTRTLDLSHLPDGIYFLYIETSRTTFIRKLVLQ